MAVPKRKTSKARRDKRRSSHWKLTPPAMTVCSNCGEYTLSHRACGNCGTYRNREVIAVKENN